MKRNNLGRGSGKLRWSKHARQRLGQRGFKQVDEDLFKAFGEQVEDGYLMTNQAIQDAQLSLKAALQRLDHLKGATLIEADGAVVTVYRADRKRVKRLQSGHVEAA